MATVSLADDRTMCLKASVGFEARAVAREDTFCSHAQQQALPFEVPDALLDSRFAANPFVVGAPHLRFYAGVSLTVGDMRVGTLCVMDTRPRLLDPAQWVLLQNLARAVELWLTTRQQQQRQLESDGFRRTLIENLNEGVMVFDRELRVLSANPKALAIGGFDACCTLPSSLMDLLDPVEHPRLRAAIAAVLRGEPQLADWVCIRAGGERYIAEISASRLDIDRVLAVVRDISQKRAQEARMHELSMAVDQSFDTIVITDTEGRIAYVNEAGVTRSGYRRDELIGRDRRLLRAPGASAEADAQSLARLQQGESWQGLLHNRRKDGRELIEAAVMSPIRRPDGQVTHHLYIKQDVTERQHLTAELERHRHHLQELVTVRTAELEQARQNAEAANRAKSAFVATLSHELRTPMNGIIGLTDVLLRSALNRSQKDLARTVRDSASALVAVVDDILDFSKAESGRLTAEPGPVPLRRLVAAVCESLQPAATLRQVALHWQVDDALPAWIETDGPRLRQILSHLVDHAIRCCAGLARAGDVRVTASGGPHGRLQLQVGDNGIGLPADLLQRIFEPFVHTAPTGQPSMSTRAGDTGMGLSIADRLAQLLGGSIAVDSKPDAGATFTVDLPLLICNPASGCASAPHATVAGHDRGDEGPVSPSSPSSPPAAPAPAVAGRVLLVDDDPFQLLLMQHQLAALSVVTVDACASGSAALQWLREHPTAGLLLLLDLNMPDMDGIEFMRHLAMQRYEGALAVLSGADPRVLESAAKLAGAYGLNVIGHAPKPAAPDVLKDLIARWRAFVPASQRTLSKRYGTDEVARAIEHGQLLLHYQPKVSLATGEPLGVEALVRWQHPTDGLLYPDSFISVAEEQGLIDALTHRVLGQALAQTRVWRDQGLRLRVAVNVSMDNLERLDFPERVVDSLNQHGLQPGDLMLEVTESRLRGSASAAVDILTRLRLKRIGLSIDDFGTGHSSLAQLLDMPFDELKIDRSFVHNSDQHASQRGIFTGSVEIAHRLQMLAVAEGVENQADWDFAKAAGCDIAQGYHIGRPMAATQLPGWVGSWLQQHASASQSLD